MFFDEQQFFEVCNFLGSNNITSGKKFFELTNHLGNVLVTITDRKQQIAKNDSVISYYDADVATANDYYPFGMVMPGRKYSAGTGYRYGFAGKEGDNEVKGEGNSLNFGNRIYDPRIMRWMSVDSKADLYPGQSPYNYALNTPLSAVDPDGRLIIFIGGLRLWQAGIDQRKFESKRKDARPGIYKDDATLQGYWRTSKNTFGRAVDMDKEFMNRIGDNNAWYASGSSQWNSKAKQRMEEGKEKAKEFHAMVQSGQITLQKDETIKIVCHSQGGAHSAGFAEQLMSYKDTEGKPLYKIEVIYYVTPHQPTEFNNPTGVKGVQYSHPGDAVSSDDPWYLPNGGSKFGRIKGVKPEDFDGRNIMEEKGGGNMWDHDNVPPCEGPTGNRCGHNVWDNDFIFNIQPNQPGYVAPRNDAPKPSSSNTTTEKKPGG